MKMKLWLYIIFFVMFVLIFSQIAFPLSAKVKSIHVNGQTSESLQVFNNIRNNIDSTQNTVYEYFMEDVDFTELKEANNHFLINYEIDVESTMLIPVEILNSKITVADKYKNRVIARVLDPYDKEVSTLKASNKRFKILVDASNMSQDEIHEMVKGIVIHITWMVVPGWERKSKVYVPEGIIAVN